MWNDCALPCVGLGTFNGIGITQFLSCWSFSTALQLLVALLSSSLLQRHTWSWWATLFTKGLDQSDRATTSTGYWWHMWCLTLWRREVTLLWIKWSTVQYLNALLWRCPVPIWLLQWDLVWLHTKWSEDKHGLQIWSNYSSPVLPASPFRCYGSQWIQYREEKGGRFC